jgi:hypothetical protein
MQPLFDRFLARLFHGPSPFLVRGSYALHHLWAPKRKINDLDLLYRGKDLIGSPAIAIWKELIRAAETDLKDGFTYKFITEPFVSESPYGPVFVIWVAACESGENFKIDIGVHPLLTPTKHLTIVSEEQLFAEKFSSYCLKKYNNKDASRDYVDLCLMAEKHTFDQKLQKVILEDLNLGGLFQVSSPLTLLQTYLPEQKWEGYYNELAGLFALQTSFRDSPTLLTSSITGRKQQEDLFPPQEL